MEQLLRDVLDGKEFINAVNIHDENALFFADAEQTKILIEMGINVNHVSTRTENALFHASPEKTELLIKAGINVNHIDSRKENALFFSNYESAKLLIEAGINVNQVTFYGRNALMRRAGIEYTQLLLEAGIDIHQTDADNKNALSHVKTGKEMQILIERGVDYNKPDKYSFFQFSPNFLEHPETVRFILTQPAFNINLRDKEGRNMLSYAKYESAKILIESGIDMHNIDYNGQCALHRADYKTSLFMFESGFDVGILSKKSQNEIINFHYNEPEKLLFLLHKGLYDNSQEGIREIKQSYYPDPEFKTLIDCFFERKELKSSVNVNKSNNISNRL